ncbi:MAG TPA: formimidoylglutamate deiminase [Gammaproteobacteria bacterium]|jgi:formimidoylglutamate deiminase|nr:formimidoylglutamate deiminase [Gammaproteobacteria bacterium]
MQSRLAFEYLLTPAGLVRDQALVVDPTGRIERVEPRGAGPCDGFLAIPGMPNAHSHAFQRALAGYGEVPSGQDSFWSWREAMYRLANRVSPEDMFIIAREAFWDMLRGGYTSVAEFHYLHHMPDGRPGVQMGRAVVAAARETGIRLRLLPVFYQNSGFGRPARDEQRRFVHGSIEDFCALLSELHGVDLGLAPHSLRAVPVESLDKLVEAASAIMGADAPIHIHISEQRREVEECQAAYGTTPVELLTKHVRLDGRWNLVHATHATEAEMRVTRESGAGVVLCPITEAYLGDGLFAAQEFVSAGGRIAIGSDSNCRIDAIEELRLLEYGQRLRQERRARLATSAGLGLPLWQLACRGGAMALGHASGALAPGHFADLVVLQRETPALRGHDVDTLMDALIIGGSRADISDVYVGGERRVHAGVCHGQEQSAHDFDEAVKRLNSV